MISYWRTMLRLKYMPFRKEIVVVLSSYWVICAMLIVTLSMLGMWHSETV